MDHEENARLAGELDAAKTRAEHERKAKFMLTVQSVARAKGLPVESVLRLTESSARRNGLTEELALKRCFGVETGDTIRTVEDNYIAFRQAMGKSNDDAGELKEAAEAYVSPRTAMKVTLDESKEEE